MDKKKIDRSTMLNLKGFLLLVAFGVWVYVIMNNTGSFKSAFEALLSYGKDTLMVIALFYILILIIEFFVGIKDTEK